MSLDEEWNNFLDNKEEDEKEDLEDANRNIERVDISKIPKCGEIYISTKTKIVYLNVEFDIYDIFWKVPITDYDKQSEGIIKKQVKISSLDREQVKLIDERLEKETYNTCKIINHIDNPNGRIKYKHIRKISIGICKKDLMFSRTKQKSAFYNCFVLTFRILYNNNFKEIHVKVFNTGKLEIPGLQNDDMLKIVLEKLINILKEITNKDIVYLKDKTENVLINSNFNCGFFINREKLFNILRHKYNINACYDPCSYPGIQCVYYYDTTKNEGISKTLNLKTIEKNNNILKISYMIFRTGSILIVGKCCEDVLLLVYEYIKSILTDEYINIMTSIIDTTIKKETKISSKLRRKHIYVK